VLRLSLPGEALIQPKPGLQLKRYFLQHSPAVRSTDMLDIILVAGALGFFALSVGYAIACDRL
jgi:hypothetical protein